MSHYTAAPLRQKRTLCCRIDWVSALVHYASQASGLAISIVASKYALLELEAPHLSEKCVRIQIFALEMWSILKLMTSSPSYHFALSFSISYLFVSVNFDYNHFFSWSSTKLKNVLIFSAPNEGRSTRFLKKLNQQRIYRMDSTSLATT